MQKLIFLDDEKDEVYATIMDNVDDYFKLIASSLKDPQDLGRRYACKLPIPMNMYVLKCPYVIVPFYHLYIIAWQTKKYWIYSVDQKSESNPYFIKDPFKG